MNEISFIVEGAHGPINITRWHRTGQMVEGAAPLIALHGFTGSGLDFAPVMAALQVVADGWAIDLPGHGASYCGNHLAHYGLDACIESVNTVLAKEGRRRLCLLGYSMGGRIALHYAHRYPERVERLILVSSSPGLADAEARRERCLQDERLAQFILEQGVDRFHEKWQAGPLITTQKNIPACIRRGMVERRLRNHPLGLAHSLRGLGTGVLPPLWDALKTIDVKTQLVTGSEDEKFNQIARQMQQCMPVAEHVIIEGAGHAPHLEALAAFTQSVSFCKK
jgi:2-succinyl-6-hydroxy-2,4-cyclohexadiene-1-carboxylate synthase